MCPHCILVVLAALFPFLGSLLLWWRGRKHPSGVEPCCSKDHLHDDLPTE
jgi:hypothetical protein